MALVASGPSLRSQDVDYLRGKCRVIVINDNFKLAPWADALYACDRDWWERKRPEFAGLKFTQYSLNDARKRAQDVATAERFGARAFGGLPHAGLSRDPDVIHYGDNSGYQAINVAYHMGATRIILLGYDMQRTGGKAHWFGDHPKGMNNLGNLPRWVKYHDALAADLKAEGVEVINCTRETALTQYPRTNLEDVL